MSLLGHAEPTPHLHFADMVIYAFPVIVAAASLAAGLMLGKRWGRGQNESLTDQQESE